MMELTDDLGKKVRVSQYNLKTFAQVVRVEQVFETISITLVCDECLKTDHPVCTTTNAQGIY